MLSSIMNAQLHDEHKYGLPSCQICLNQIQKTTEAPRKEAPSTAIQSTAQYFSDNKMGSPTVNYSTVTTVLQISDYGNGKYEIKEVKADEAVLPDLHSANRKQIEFPLPIPAMAVRFAGIRDQVVKN